MRVRGEQLKTVLLKPTGKAKFRLAFCDFSLCPSLASSVNSASSSDGGPEGAFERAFMSKQEEKVNFWLSFGFLYLYHYGSIKYFL